MTTTTTRRTDMARVTVTDYELEHDLLPAVCVRCGAPAADRVEQTLHILDGPRGTALVLALLFGLFFFPPLVRLVTRKANSVSARLPMCRPHADGFRARTEWVDRVGLPVWTAAALVSDGLMVADFLTGDPGGSCFAPVVLLLAWAMAVLVVVRGRVGIERSRKMDLRLTGVSEEFATALAADRARDRVSNPDRRGGHGDQRDDYDDEVV